MLFLRIYMQNVFINPLNFIIMSKNKANKEMNDVENDVENVTNEVTSENVTEVTSENESDDRSDEQKKAVRILHAKIPELVERGLNFEKRTGNCFKGVLVDVVDPDGLPVLKNGVPEQRISRIVQTIENEETGELLPEFAVIKDALTAKRSAAFIDLFEKNNEKLLSKKADLLKQVEAVETELSEMDTKLIEAKQVVMSFELPEPIKRENLTVKLTAAQEQIELMRQKLIAAGIDPDDM